MAAQVGSPDLRPRADVGELDPLRLAHLAQERARELGLRADLARELVLQHELLGGERRADRARAGGRRFVLLGEGREVVGAAADRIEERVVGLVEPRLLARELRLVQERRGREPPGE